MNWKKLKEILDKEFPIECIHEEGDYIGEQVKIKDNINNVMVTLDITLDVIYQAKNNNIDLIISHHPLVFGNKDLVLIKNKFLKSKIDLLEKLNIGIYIIHTNADYNFNSIAHRQAIALNLKNIKQENKYVTGNLKEKKLCKFFIEDIKNNLKLNNVEFRSNFDLDHIISNVRISSGASGSEIDFNNDVVNLIGEIKHHEWVIANERGAKVIEISHYSEKIFKDYIKLFLKKYNVEVIKSKEKNGYKIY